MAVAVAASIKGVNTVTEVVPIWSLVRYISDTDQYRYTVSVNFEYRPILIYHFEFTVSSKIL